ncbi:ATP-binding protein [Winogradskyella sp.]|uniref:tetratricopeptide repeat-containing sensor histidine kinase n=1 Tax=Winogradskyella sp. TaxID=1883156 RepID=UPI003BAC14DC
MIDKVRLKFNIYVCLFLVFHIGFGQEKTIDEEVLQNIPVKNVNKTLEERFSMYFRGLSLLDKASDSVKLKFYDAYSKELTLEKIYEEAINLCHKGIALSKASGIDYGLFDYYNRLSSNYPRVNKLDSATWAYKKALKVTNKVGTVPPYYDLPVANNLGYHYYLNLQAYDSALHYLNYRQKYPKDIISKVHFYYSMNDNVALVYMAQNEFEKARNLFKENYAYYGSDDAFHFDQERFIRAGLQWADAEMHLGNLKLAKRLISDIGHILDTISYYDLKHRSKLLLLQTQMDYARRAYDYTRFHELNSVYHKFKDSLDSAESMKRQSDLTLLRQIGLQNAENNLKNEQRISDIEKENLRLSLNNRSAKIYWILSLVILLSILIFTFFYFKRVRIYSESKQKLQEQFSQDLISAQEKERTRLAMELHDGIGQRLMLLTRKTKQFNNHSMDDLAQGTLEELRAISRGLHPAVLDRLGFKKAIDALIKDIDKDSDILFTSDVIDIGHAIPKDVAIHLYRMIQECLNNIIKHSEAKSASITIESDGSLIYTRITDNGIGFDVSQAFKNKMSLGMKTIKERAKIIKSQFKIDSNDALGTTVTITTPIYDN